MHLEHLKTLEQWVCSKPVKRDGKITKPPFMPNGRLASVTDPKTWCAYDVALKSDLPYYGFVLTESDPYTIIDLDEPDNEEQAERHKQIIAALDSYTETSVSNTGVHIIVKGHIPRGVRRDNVEIYSTERFMVFTEHPIRDKPIENRQELLTKMFEQMDDKSKVELDERDAVMTDTQVVQMGENATNGDKFLKLCRGEWQQDYPSQSEADLALISMLAFYSKSNDQVRRLFRMSGLGKREKAQRDRYLDYAIKIARAKEPPPVDISTLKTFETEEIEIQRNGKSLDITMQVELSANAEITEEPFAYPPGLLGEVAEYIYKSSVRPVREVGLAAAIGLFAGVCGRGFNVSGTGLNQYILFLAGTGTGKDGITAGIERILVQMRKKIPSIERCIGPAGFASGQALVRSLDNCPCFVSILGEFGLTLQQLCDNRANAGQMMLKRALLDLYARSGYGKILRSNVYADSDKNTKTIASPAVSLLGESTPETFYSYIDETHIQEGLVPRFSIIEYKGKRPKRNKRGGGVPDPIMIEALNSMAVEAMTNENNGTVSPVECTREASLLLDQFDEAADDKINEGSNEIDIQLWNRAHLKALKLAALVAVGVDHSRPVISTEVAQWSIEFIHREISEVSRHYMSGEHSAGDGRQEMDVRAAINSYTKMSQKLRRQYKVPETLLKENKLVPYSYLRTRLIKLKSFREDKRGATYAVKSTLKEMVETNAIGIVPPSKATGAYNTSVALYYRGDLW